MKINLNDVKSKITSHIMPVQPATKNVSETIIPVTAMPSIVKTEGKKENILKIENFSLSFGENELFRNLNYEFTPGIYTFTGPSGVGKSTLLRAIAGLNPNYTGTISINGVQYKKPTPMVHMVHQHYTSFPWLNCIENTLMVYKGHRVRITKEMRENAINVLKSLGLEEHLNKKPGQLSGGQDQRLSLASALINNISPVIVYDEMTSALDEKNDFVVAELIKSHQRANNNIVIVITHEEHVKKALGGTDIFFSESFRLH
ncbi:MAG: ABC transporter ATP-binding protein [Clostridiales bacterium]|nr:ABC transporter ATP-binding protein [Clostridiales bacterium]